MAIPSTSFEFFPPRSLPASFELWTALQELAALDPAYVSVTYGAGGATRALTHETVEAIARGRDLPICAHLTCVGASKAETLEVAERYAQAGVTQIMALRGDPPEGQSAFAPHPQGFADSVALIRALADMERFTIRVAAYPTPHPEAKDATSDVTWLKAKVEAGASEAVTQFFFDPEDFLRFRDRCDRGGIKVPILPGILPIPSWSQVTRFATRCGVSIPPRLDAKFQTALRDGRADLLALAECTALCDRLLTEGVEHLHFYTLNRPDLTRDVCRALGIRSRAQVVAA